MQQHIVAIGHSLSPSFSGPINIFLLHLKLGQRRGIGQTKALNHIVIHPGGILIGLKLNAIRHKLGIAHPLRDARQPKKKAEPSITTQANDSVILTLPDSPQQIPQVSEANRFFESKRQNLVVISTDFVSADRTRLYYNIELCLRIGQTQATERRKKENLITNTAGNQRKDSHRGLSQNTIC